MWLRLTVLLAVCAHLQHAQKPVLVSAPVLEDYSTQELILLLCNTSTPDVTYTWLDKNEKVVSVHQIYRRSRPKEDVTLTCVAENFMSIRNVSITIPFFPDCGGLGGGGIAAIVLGVLLGLLLLLIILVICLCVKSVKAVGSIFSCFKGGSEDDDAEKGEKMDPLEKKGGSSNEDDEDKGQCREMLEKRAEAE